jgi:hypothetical protein
MERAEQSTLGTNPKEAVTITGTEDWFVNIVWGKHINFLNTLPEEWYAYPEQIDLNVKFDWDGQIDSLPKDSIYIRRIKVASKKAIKLPPHMQAYYGSSTLCLGFKPGDEVPEVLQAVKEYALKEKEISDRWDKIMSQVREFLENCKSLNEALKLWPDLRVYIPNDYLERVEKKAQRSGSSTSSAAEVLAKIDTQEVQAAAVIARLSGASV